MQQAHGASRPQELLERGGADEGEGEGLVQGDADLGRHLLADEQRGEEGAEIPLALGFPPRPVVAFLIPVPVQPTYLVRRPANVAFLIWGAIIPAALLLTLPVLAPM